MRSPLNIVVWTVKNSISCGPWNVPHNFSNLRKNFLKKVLTIQERSGILRRLSDADSQSPKAIEKIEKSARQGSEDMVIYQGRV